MKYLVSAIGVAIMIMSIFIDGTIGWAIWSLGLLTWFVPLASNWLKGVFIHKKNDKNHSPVERYSGLTNIGYKCRECGYEWYEKRSKQMTELTDLEICKKIAEIEGVHALMMKSAFGMELRYMDEGHGGYKVYNPLEDDALCFQLMKKHDVDNSRAGVQTETGESVYCAKKHDSNAELVFSRFRNKVILLAIIEAHSK